MKNLTILLTMLVVLVSFVVAHKDTTSFRDVTIYYGDDADIVRMLGYMQTFPPELFDNLRHISFTDIKHSKYDGFYTYNGGMGSIIIYYALYYDEQLLMHELRHNYWYTSMNHPERMKYYLNNCLDKSYRECREVYADDFQI